MSTTRAWIAAFLVVPALTVLFFHPVFLRGEVISPNDIAFTEPPHSGLAPAGFKQPRNYLLADQLQQFFPSRTFIREQIRKGEWSWWHPNLLCGKSLALDISCELFSPFHIFSWITALPQTIGQTLALLIKVIVAGWGMLMLGRLCGLCAGGAVLGAISFSYGSYMIEWLGHPHASVVAILPWLMWAIGRAVWTPGSPVADIARVAICAGLLIAGSHPNSIIVSCFGSGLFALYALARSNASMWLRSLLVLAAGAVLGALLTAIMTLPFAMARLSGEFMYGNRMEMAIRVAPLAWVDLASSLIPSLQGSPLDLSHPVQGGYNHHNAFAGVSALLVALATLPWSLRRREGPFFLILGLLILATVLGCEPFSSTVRGLPLLRDNAPERMLLLLQIAVSMLAACGWSSLMRSGETFTRAQGNWCSAILLICFAGSLVAFVEGVPGMPWVLFGLLGGTLSVAIALWLPAARSVATALLSCVLFAEMWHQYSGYNTTLPLHVAEAPVKAKAPTFAGGEGGDWFRSTALDGTWLPNLCSIGGLLDIRGYDVPIARRYREFLGHAFYGGQWNYNDIYWHAGAIDLHDPGNQALLGLMGVRYVMASDANGIQVWENPSYRLRLYSIRRAVPASGDVNRDVEALREADMNVVADERVIGPAAFGSAEILESDESADRVRARVRAGEGGAMLALNETALPGWQVRVDGNQADLVRANVIHWAVHIPAGDHTVDFKFTPPGLLAGTVLTCGSAILVSVLLGLAWSARRGHRRDDLPFTARS